eukprot:scaffold127408_cov63-Phaeocystis_antarctica.AAC.3
MELGLGLGLGLLGLGLGLGSGLPAHSHHRLWRGQAQLGDDGSEHVLALQQALVRLPGPAHDQVGRLDCQPLWVAIANEAHAPPLGVHITADEAAGGSVERRAAQQASEDDEFGRGIPLRLAFEPWRARPCTSARRGGSTELNRGGEAVTHREWLCELTSQISQFRCRLAGGQSAGRLRWAKAGGRGGTEDLSSVRRVPFVSASGTVASPSSTPSRRSASEHAARLLSLGARCELLLCVRSVLL